LFHKPVDAESLGLVDYHQVIKNPMDFGTIKMKLSNNDYEKLEEFLKDMK